MAKAKVYAVFWADKGIKEEFNPPVQWTLEQMQKCVGGYIEYCRTTIARRALVVNENGLYTDLPINPLATQLVSPDVLMAGPLKGNAILVSIR